LTIIGIPRVPAAAARARRLDGAYPLLGEVSRALGTSASTVRRLAAADPIRFGPARQVRWGTVWMPLFDLDTVGRLHAHLAAQRTARGRPRLWSEEELRHRRAAVSAIGYRRRRALKLQARGDTEGAARLLADAARRHRMLSEARCARLASVDAARGRAGRVA
jgi:hypothetical protein